MNVSLQVVGKLKQGVSLGQAQPEVEAVAAQDRQTTPILATAGYRIRLEPMKAYLVAPVRPAILALMGAVIFLLLIACSNVANLMLVRASLRERELAVRSALGGSRWQLTRQMLAEALLLSALGPYSAWAWLGLACGNCWPSRRRTCRASTRSPSTPPCSPSRHWPASQPRCSSAPHPHCAPHGLT